MSINLIKKTIMKKLLTIAAAILFAGYASAQVMMEVPIAKRFHAMSENGKYLLAVDNNGYLGIYNTKTGDYDEYTSLDKAYDLGMGNMVTNDGFLVGSVGGMPSILDIEKKEWTPLGMNPGEENLYSCANCINQSGEYIVGFVATASQKFNSLVNKPVLWTRGSDGKYGVYEELPYPEKDFMGTTPKYILPNCISEDGTVIAAQLMTQENNCLPMVYRKQQDGTWTYEVYDKNLCEPGTVFPEYPDDQPIGPEYRDYMTEEKYNQHEQDMQAYKDSLWLNTIGEGPKPTYYPDERDYMTEEERTRYDNDWVTYQEEDAKFWEQLNAFREFIHENVTPNFYAQNGVWMPANGKYFATTKKDWNTAGGSALLTIGDEMELQEFDDGLYGYSATNDGDFFVSDWSTAYVYPAGSTEKMTLVDWLRLKGENEAADWLQNIPTGTAICNATGRILSGFTGGAGAYNSWFIDLDGTPTGITEVEGGTENDADKTVKVYDLQGRLITEGKAGEVTKSLGSGIYIVGKRKVVIR